MKFCLSENNADLQGILDLQEVNHKDYLPENEKKLQGFVTVRHTFSQLSSLNSIEKHVIAKENNEVGAYVLAMTKKSRNLIPVLEPMFEIFDNISFKGKKISDYHYMVVGQVCVGEKYRGKNVFDEVYYFYKNQYAPFYDFCITEIAVENTRSIRAHHRIGFETIHQYTDQFGINWFVVVWDWK